MLSPAGNLNRCLPMYEGKGEKMLFFKNAFECWTRDNKLQVNSKSLHDKYGFKL